MIERGEFSLGKDLIANGRIHDYSKFHGIEWDHLGIKGDPLHEEAWRHHVANNRHHPEAWEGGIHIMERLYIYEMVADWHARASEFGTDLRQWIRQTAMPRFEFDHNDKIYSKIKQALDLLVEPSFT